MRFALLTMSLSIFYKTWQQVTHEIGEGGNKTGIEGGSLVGIYHLIIKFVTTRLKVNG